MDKIDHSVMSMIGFLLLVLFIGIFGFILVTNNRQVTPEKKVEVNLQEKSNQYLKIDPDQDYVYFTNYRLISTDLEIYYADLNFNFNSVSAANLAKTLNQQTKELEQKVEYISEHKYPEEQILTNVDNIYAATIREYKTINYEKYLTIIVNDILYSCTGLLNSDVFRAYVFNLETGEQMLTADFLAAYQISQTTLFRRINEQITSLYNENTALIKYEETINNVKTADGLNLYINEDGHLIAKIVVFTNEINYNEDIIIE